MTLAMPDSIRPQNIPGGAWPAALGYVDGYWPTAAALAARFPRAHILTLTVTGVAGADGCDCETGDLTVAQAVAWARRRLAAGAWRPVIYANVSTMFGVISELEAAGIPLDKVRLLSAHYGLAAHICGPSTCAYQQAGRMIPAMDGTQWTDAYDGLNGTKIDMSRVVEGFFSPPPPAPAVEDTDMIIVRATISGQVRTYTYDGTTVRHIVSEGDQAALAAVLKTVDVSEAQLAEFNGGTLPPA